MQPTYINITFIDILHVSTLFQSLSAIDLNLTLVKENSIQWYKFDENQKKKAFYINIETV